MEQTKICPRCKVFGTLSDFYRDARAKDGHASECKLCSDERRTQLRQQRKNDKLMEEFL